MGQLIIPDEATSATFHVTGAQASLPFGFAVFSKADLHVSVGGWELSQSDFTLVGTPLTGGGYQGGTVVLSSAVSNTTCKVWREVVLARTSNFSPAVTVPVRDLDTSLSRAMAISQDAHRDLGRALLVPADETADLLPPASIRANQILGFDSQGRPAVGIPTTGPLGAQTDLSNVSNSVLASRIGLFDSRATAAAATMSVLLNIVTTRGYSALGDGGGANYVRALSGSPGGFQSADGVWWKIADTTISPKQFGAKADGTNDVAAVRLWAAALGPGIQGVGASTTAYSLDAATLSDTGIPVGAGARISGLNLLVIGTGSGNLFTATDVDDLIIEKCRFYGNNQASGYGLGYAISVNLSSGATASLSHFRIRDCRFYNFKGDYWINFINLSATYSITDGRISGNSFYSFSGNSRDPNSLGTLSVNVNLNANGAGGIGDFWVTENYSDAKWIKTFCAVFSYAHDMHLDGNTVDNAGQGEAVPDKGAYAFLVYGSTSTPNRISVSHNVINSPFCNGLYAPAAVYLSVIGNTISNQTDTADSSLPKAAITITGTYNTLVADNIFFGNFCDIALEGPNGGGEAAISVTGNVSAGGFGRAFLRVLPNIGVSWSGLTVTGNDVKHAVKAIECRASATEAITDIVITGNRLEAPYCIDLNGRNIPAVGIASVTISGNRLRSSSYGIYAYATDGVSILSNEFRGISSGAQVYAEAATNINAQDNTHRGQTAGNVYIAPGATGGMWGNNFWNCISPTAPGAGMLGYSRPTYSGFIGMTVQNLNLSTDGAAGGTYTTLGWVCMGGTTWKDYRIPDQDNSAV